MKEWCATQVVNPSRIVAAATIDSRSNEYAQETKQDSKTQPRFPQEIEGASAVAVTRRLSRRAIVPQRRTTQSTRGRGHKQSSDPMMCRSDIRVDDRSLRSSSQRANSIRVQHRLAVLGRETIITAGLDIELPAGTQMEDCSWLLDDSLEDPSCRSDDDHTRRATEEEQYQTSLSNVEVDRQDTVSMQTR